MKLIRRQAQIMKRTRKHTISISFFIAWRSSLLSCKRRFRKSKLKQHFQTALNLSEDTRSHLMKLTWLSLFIWRALPKK